MVDSGHIRAELSHITRLEFYGLEFNDDITTQSRVVKQHIYELLCASYDQAIFSPHKCKSSTEFQEELFDVFHKSPLQFLFFVRLCQSCKIKQVWGFRHFLCQIALGEGQ